MIQAAISGEWLILAGAITAILGAAVGAWIAARLTYGFQQKLLQQQLDFQTKQADLDATQRKEIADELNTKIQLLRDTIHHKRIIPHPQKGLSIAGSLLGEPKYSPNEKAPHQAAGRDAVGFSMARP